MGFRGPKALWNRARLQPCRCRAERPGFSRCARPPRYACLPRQAGAEALHSYRVGGTAEAVP